MNVAKVRDAIKRRIGKEKFAAYLDGREGGQIYQDFQYILHLDFAAVIRSSDELDRAGDLPVIFFTSHAKSCKEILRKKGIAEEKLIDHDELISLFDIDPVILAKGRKIAIWGAGSLSTFVHMYDKMDALGITPDFYLDNDCAKHGGTYDGLPIKDYDALDISEKEKLFIVVCSAYYQEIEEQLLAKGLVKDKDFVSYISIIRNAAYMMRKTLHDKKVNGPVCTLPFEMANIHREGIYVCPPDWINQLPIGTSTQNDLNDAWNSISAEIFRLSIENGTYSFCNLGLCGLMNGQTVEYKDKGAQDWAEKYKKRKSPSMLVVSHDHSCNLWCESCRKCRQIAEGAEFAYAEKITEQLEKSGWLDESEKLLLAGDGEVFSSRVYQKILYDPKRTRKSVCILSNGNLLDKKRLDELLSRYSELDIEISIDAARKDTYEELRRGGNWNRLMDNLNAIGDYRQKGKIRYFGIRMVVQSKNIEEMPEFVELGKSVHADLVRFARIRNFGSYAKEQFQEISITTEKNSEGKLKPEYKEIMKDQRLLDPIVGLYDMEKLLNTNRDISLREISQKYHNLIYL